VPEELTAVLVVLVVVLAFGALLWRRWARHDRGEASASRDATVDVIRDNF
jgi:hypothetical protein